jgi:hypothetical protein
MDIMFPVSKKDQLKSGEKAFIEIICGGCKGVLAKSKVEVSAGDIVGVDKFERGEAFRGKWKRYAVWRCKNGDEGSEILYRRALKENKTMKCSEISQEMKERLLRVRLATIKYQARILFHGNEQLVLEVATEYEKKIRGLFNDNAKFRRWCKQAFGSYPEEILEGKKEKTAQEIADFINNKIDKAVKVLREQGLDIELV